MPMYVQEAEEMMAEKDERINELEYEVEQLCAKEHDMSGEIAGLREKHEELSNDLEQNQADFEEALDVAYCEIGRLEQDVEDLSYTKAELEDSLRKAEEKSNGLNGVKEMQKRLAEKDMRNDELEKEKSEKVQALEREIELLLQPAGQLELRRRQYRRHLSTATLGAGPLCTPPLQVGGSPM